MASLQAYQAYSQNKGTLVPGQSITVNKFTVQVERYLAQGGFAHVYLVRTATPVYNTTHHVLKRIAVASEAMLIEVKKEVDVMRLLKGHPNIVHLIDAAWHQMPSGTYEVFILMEFCPGGGIIDMMNRRLRERLTEAEILQIFVDVCEGVAHMHNLRPALLHRDLKVENILQSSATSYKLCDFGSATTISRPPSNTQEFRALEADLNRHTTLQYRAPEMVDVYSRRPVDEKSDVWALGVLLYKLCYYTTPFEEHGQLAILNVQYRIPPYPVYSPQMNQLIASMLQEHGIRRPTVFELLGHVHRLRGTKSRFKYTIPEPQPLSPRHQTQFRHFPSSHRSGMTNAASLNKAPISVSPPRSQGIQAREKVMEAIAPIRQGEQSFETGSSLTSVPQKISDTQTTQFMRRGRPAFKDPALSTEPSRNQKSSNEMPVNRFEGRPESEDHLVKNDAWKTKDAGKTRDNLPAGVWDISGKPSMSNEQDKHLGFGDDFAEKLWDSVGTKPPNHPISNPLKPTLTQPHGPAITNRRPSPSKDAFDGLGLGFSLEKPAPTLAEARKLRTGLAITSSHGFRTNPDKSGSTGIIAPRLTPSPRQPLPVQLQLYPSSVTSSTPKLSLPLSSGLSPQPHSRRTTPSQPEGFSAESRFPSLEELDAGFSHSLPSGKDREQPTPLVKRNDISARPGVSEIGLLKPDSRSQNLYAHDGSRPQQVIGISMGGSRPSSSDRTVDSLFGDSTPLESKQSTSAAPPRDETDVPPRPNLMRKHRSSVSVKHITQPSSSDIQTTSFASPPRLAKEVETLLLAQKKPKDWLTGSDDLDDPLPKPHKAPSPSKTAILRESPSKRASFIQNSSFPIQDAIAAQHDHIEPTKLTPSHIPLTPEPQISPTISKFTLSFPPIGTQETANQDTQSKKQTITAVYIPEGQQRDDSGSSDDEGPEDVAGIIHTTSEKQPQRRNHKGRQSSVHDLVDLYGGGHVPREKGQDMHLYRTLQTDSEHTVQDLKGRSMAPLSLKPSAPSSSNTLLSPSDMTSPGQANSGEQSSPPFPTPSQSRSRPQSMFIFPSKSTDHIPPSTTQPSTSPGLAPPGDAKIRANVRRTSISEIVQRFEGIGAGVKSAPPLSPGLRPVGSISSDVRFPRGQPTIEGERATMSLSIPGEVDSQSSRGLDPTRTSPTTPISKPIPLQYAFRKELEDSIPQMTTSNPDKLRPKLPSRKATETLSRPESGSSSPERPYRGVGKLIDQWQRKTAEAEPQRAPLRGRGTSVAKRASEIRRGSSK